MPRNARVVAPGLPYHITQRGTNRERVFFTVADRTLYLRLIHETQAEAGVRILAYALMTNHVHFIAVPSREESLALLFGRVNGRYAQALNIRKGRTGHLWQARFHSCAMSESHLWVGLRHVEANPYRAGLVQSPQEYRWSSAAPHLLGTPDRSRILDLDFWEKAGGRDAWAQLHQVEDRPHQIIEFQNCTYSGRPFGDEVFVSAMEVRFQRKWRKGAGSAIGKIAMSA